MPEIKQYTQQTNVAGAPDVRLSRGDEFSGAGQGMQHLANAGFELADVIKRRKEQEEVSNVHVELSKAHAAYSKQYQQQLQDGSLDTEEFTKGVSDYMDKVGENVNTRAGRLYFNQASAELKSHFLQTASAGQAELAGARAKQNYMETLNNGSSALVNDPSSFSTTLKMQMDGIDQLVKTGGLPAKAAAELKVHSETELAKSAVRGWIQLNPEGAKEDVNSGKWDKFFDGDVKHQLLGEADQAVRARSAEDERMQKLQKDALKTQQEKTQNDFLAKISNNELDTKTILNSNLDAFGSGSKEQFIQMLKQKQKDDSEKIRTDPTTFIDIWDKIHLPDGDPQKVVDENDLNKFMGRGLTVQDINTLRGEIQNKKTLQGADENEMLKGVTDIGKGMLTKSNPLLGIRDPVGDTQYQKFLVSFLQEYRTQRQKGKSAKELLSPDSPDYLGKNVYRYVRSSTQIIQDLVKSSATGPTPAPVSTTPRKEGESAADYLKRTGK